MDFNFRLNHDLTVTARITTKQVSTLKENVDITKSLSEQERGFLKSTSYFVKASNYAISELFATWRNHGFPKNAEIKHTLEIGSIVDEPVTLSLTYYLINRRVICFCDMEGEYAIWPMAERFLNKYRPEIKRTDACRFETVLNSIPPN